MNTFKSVLTSLLTSPNNTSSVYNFPKCEAKAYGKLVEYALKEIKKSGQLILGPGVRVFEESFASWLGNDIQSDQVIGLANGTDALKLALMLLESKQVIMLHCLHIQPMQQPQQL